MLLATKDVIAGVDNVVDVACFRKDVEDLSTRNAENRKNVVHENVERINAPSANVLVKSVGEKASAALRFAKSVGAEGFLNVKKWVRDAQGTKVKITQQNHVNWCHASTQPQEQSPVKKKNHSIISKISKNVAMGTVLTRNANLMIRTAKRPMKHAPKNKNAAQSFVTRKLLGQENVKIRR